MNDKKIELLTTYLSLYIDHHTVLADMQNATGKYVVLDVRNAPAQVKKDQIKGAIAMPAKDLATRIGELDPAKTYVVCDWTGEQPLARRRYSCYYPQVLKHTNWQEHWKAGKGCNYQLKRLRISEISI